MLHIKIILLTLHTFIYLNSPTYPKRVKLTYRMLFQYDQEWVDDDGIRRFRYNYPRRHRRRARNEYAEQFFKKRRPKIKLFPGMPLKINENKSKTANDLDHQIESIKTNLKQQYDEDINFNIDDMDQNLLDQIDLSISQEPKKSSLKLLMKNDKLINVIEIEDSQEIVQLDVGREKIKQNYHLPLQILNPTKDQLHHAIQAMKRQFKHLEPSTIISKLYTEVIVNKMPLNYYLYPFWTRKKDEDLLNSFIKHMNIEKASYHFYIDHTSINMPSIQNRLTFLLKKSMVRYNQEVQIFKSSLANLNKIGEEVVELILSNQNKLAIQFQVLLIKLYLSVRIDRQFFYQVASKLNLLFQSTMPLLRPK